MSPKEYPMKNFSMIDRLQESLRPLRKRVAEVGQIACLRRSNSFPLRENLHALSL